MALRSAVLGTVVALGTHWPLLDAPYPDSYDGAAAEAAVSPQSQVEAAIVRYARSHQGSARRPDIAQLRIDGCRATALLTTGRRVEWVHLEKVPPEDWRVVQTFKHR